MGATRRWVKTRKRKTRTHVWTQLVEGGEQHLGHTVPAPPVDGSIGRRHVDGAVWPCTAVACLSIATLEKASGTLCTSGCACLVRGELNLHTRVYESYSILSYCRHFGFVMNK